MVNKVVSLTWSGGLDVYNLYDECAGGISRKNFQKTLIKNGRKLIVFSCHLCGFLGGLSFDIVKNMGALQDAPPCTNDTALEVYFNSKKTKEALHVKEDITWTLCNEGLDYQTQVQDVSEYIKHALDTVSNVL